MVAGFIGCKVGLGVRAGGQHGVRTGGGGTGAWNESGSAAVRGEDDRRDPSVSASEWRDAQVGRARPFCELGCATAAPVG
jgi:hypothetical protein